MRNLPPLGVAVVGLGAWGPNLARNGAEARGARLVALCDRDPGRLSAVSPRFPGVRTHATLEACLADPSVDAVVVAVPAGAHARVATAALKAGKDVLVEKPLATSLADARRLAALAKARGRMLGVGHTFEYSPAVDRIRDLIRGGELGHMQFVLARRLSLGSLRQDVDALWNLAPHDISILTHVLGIPPRRVAAQGATYLQKGIADLVLLELEFPGGVLAQVQVSWLFPTKIREMIFVGSRRMLIYDDVSADQKLRIYDRGFDRRQEPTHSYGEFQLVSRMGDLHIPRVPAVEPLKRECQDFVDACRRRRPMRAGATRGLLVVGILETASRSMRLGGRRLPFRAT
jgi:predicted dehydrogenase